MKFEHKSKSRPLTEGEKEQAGISGDGWYFQPYQDSDSAAILYKLNKNGQIVHQDRYFWAI